MRNDASSPQFLYSNPAPVLANEFPAVFSAISVGTPTISQTNVFGERRIPFNSASVSKELNPQTGYEGFGHALPSLSVSKT
jgi:hypothetical protein